ncbi:MAG TPA: UPF0149 family protein [Candidatus Dormibacteraeota bacterium]|nr:UPF0149 family protein [Candidatus Dormibacteraeota bacterium]
MIVHDRLTAAERDELEALMQARNPGGSHGGSITWLHGLLTAVLSGPLVPPSQWVPFVFGGLEGPGWADIEQAQRGMTLLMRFHNEVAADLQSEDNFRIMIDRIGEPPDTVDYADDWCAGYMDWVGEHMDDWTNATESAEITKCFTPILNLCEPDEDDVLDPVRQPKRYRKALDALADCALDIYDWWQAYLASHRAPAAPIRRTAAKVRANDPCPCGSAKKYKRCCSPLRPLE